MAMPKSIKPIVPVTVLVKNSVNNTAARIILIPISSNPIFFSKILMAYFGDYKIIGFA